MKAAEDLDKKLLAIENRLASPALLDSDDKYFVEPYQVYLNLIWLNAEVGTGGGDVAGGADFAPTDTQMELLQGFVTEMAGVDTDYQKAMKEDLAAFNRTLMQGAATSLRSWLRLSPKRRNNEFIHTSGVSRLPSTRPELTQ